MLEQLFNHGILFLLVPVAAGSFIVGLVLVLGLVWFLNKILDIDNV